MPNSAILLYFLLFGSIEQESIFEWFKQFKLIWRPFRYLTPVLLVGELSNFWIFDVVFFAEPLLYKDLKKKAKDFKIKKFLSSNLPTLGGLHCTCAHRVCTQ